MFKWFLIFYFKIFILKLVVPINTIRSKTFEHLREMKKGEKTNRATWSSSLRNNRYCSNEQSAWPALAFQKGGIVARRIF